MRFVTVTIAGLMIPFGPVADTHSQVISIISLIHMTLANPAWLAI